MWAAKLLFNDILKSERIVHKLCRDALFLLYHKTSLLSGNSPVRILIILLHNNLKSFL